MSYGYDYPNSDFHLPPPPGHLRGYPQQLAFASRDTYLATEGYGPLPAPNSALLTHPSYKSPTHATTPPRGYTPEPPSNSQAMTMSDLCGPSYCLRTPAYQLATKGYYGNVGYSYMAPPVPEKTLSPPSPKDYM